MVSSGQLAIVDVVGEEEVDLFVEFARHIDDGEAMACALAERRGYALATDDRKALNLLTRRRSLVQVLTTSELIRNWSESAAVPGDELGRVLTLVETIACFVPGRRDPLQQWWFASRSC